jgi:hypothetical protein
MEQSGRREVVTTPLLSRLAMRAVTTVTGCYASHSFLHRLREVSSLLDESHSKVEFAIGAKSNRKLILITIYRKLFSSLSTKVL